LTAPNLTARRLTARRRKATDGRELLLLLERVRADYGPGTSATKRSLVTALDRARMPDARSVLRLHEALLFLSAVPDDAALRADVVRALGRFRARPDLKRFRRALADTGIAGTDIHYPFFSYTARWLAARWPAALAIDWPAWENADGLEEWLPHLLPYVETLTLDTLTFAPRTWLRILRRRGESDAAFLIRRFARLDASSFARETAYDSLALPLVLKAGPTTPERTTARWPAAPLVPQTRPLHPGRPDLRRALRVPPRSITPVSARVGERLLSLTREAMVTRARDLDAFEKADVRDVRMVDCGEGLQFACFGVVPSRRLVLESVYGFLTLKNGVPIGYVLASALFGSSEVAYNVFETWRGAESAHVYARILAMLHSLFGSTSFAIDPYQLGHDNEEGQRSGAWWFYHKLGFRPVDPKVVALARREVARVRANPRHRSSPETVHRLAAGFMFLHAGRERTDVMGLLGLENVGLRVTRRLAEQGGADREGAVDAACEEARRLLGLTPRALRGWPRDERQAAHRWGPLVVTLPGVARWTVAERRDLADVVRAKGGRRESEFVARFDRHAKLRRAICALAQPPG